MSAETALEFDGQIQSALNELQIAIQQHYPGAMFEQTEGDDPEGIYLRAIVDLDDVDEVLDVVLDRLFDLQVEQGLPVYVLPLQPLERVLADYGSAL